MIANQNILTQIIGKLSRAKYYLKQRISLFRDRLKGKKIIHFLHIGKTGGTAVKYALQKHKTQSSFSIYLHKHAVKLQDIPEGEKFFFAVREPTARFVSGFYSRFRKGQPRYNTPWSAMEHKVFTAFNTPDKLACALTSDDEQERSIAHLGMNSIGHLSSFQLDWLGSKKELEKRKDDILIVIRQESLSNDFTVLKSLLNMGDEVKLPDAKTKEAHVTPIKYDKRLSQKALANIKEWYKRDYDFLDFLEKFN